MKFKQFRKKLLIFSITSVSAFGFPITTNIKQNQTNFNNGNENNLSLTTPENEINKMSQLNFKYSSGKNNYLYITDSNKNEIAKNVSIYMFNNERDYYDAALETLPEEVKKTFINNNIKNLKMSLAKEYENIGWTFNMYYISGKNPPVINNIYRLRIFQCPFLEYLKWNNIGNNQYTISFSLPTTWSIGNWAMTNEYVTDDKLTGSFSEMKLNPNIMTFSFSNIIFQMLTNNISSFYYADIDLMNLTSETVKNLFKLYNNLLPFDLNYSVSLSNNLYLFNLKRVSYKIQGNQNFTLYYEGNYSISFTESNYNFNWEIISSTYSLITVTEKNITDNLILNKYYKEKISSFKIDKNYNDNTANIEVIFDETKYKNLIFYDLLKSYFISKSFTINFQQNIDINFKLLDNHKQILLNNFNAEYVTASFVYYPYSLEIIELTSIIKNTLVNSVSFTAKLKAIVDKNNYIIDVNGSIDDFEFFNLFSEEKIKKFLIDNFYENEEFNYKKLKEDLNKQSTWNYICNYSKNLIFKNININNNINNDAEDTENLEISFDIYNNLNNKLDSKKIEIVLERNSNKSIEKEKEIETNLPEIIEIESFNLNYFYFLLLIIPIIFVIFLTWKRLNKKKLNKK